MSAVKVAPSILSADFGKLAEEVRAVEAAGADYIHVDVMDGRFVPNLTIGPVVVEAVRKATTLPLDVHLMIVEPEKYIPDFVKAGASIITVHVETCPHLNRTLEQIRQAGVAEPFQLVEAQRHSTARAVTAAASAVDASSTCRPAIWNTGLQCRGPTKQHALSCSIS